jgi:uncharacterized protein YtpQ (UPF0354 family)
MAGSPLEALAYLKAEIPADDPGPVMEVSEQNAPVLRKLVAGILVAYVIDAGNLFSYIQGKDLVAAGIDADQLHARAVENLRRAAKGRVTIRQAGAVWALFFDGNFEASLILLDELWDRALHQYHGGRPVAAFPARDVLCFCDASSSDGILELRGVVGRVWPTGDHLLSDGLFQRKAATWVPYDGQLP